MACCLLLRLLLCVEKIFVRRLAFHVVFAWEQYGHLDGTVISMGTGLHMAWYSTRLVAKITAEKIVTNLQSRKSLETIWIASTFIKLFT
jgi:hypothetical protein